MNYIFYDIYISYIYYIPTQYLINIKHMVFAVCFQTKQKIYCPDFPENLASIRSSVTSSHTKKIMEKWCRGVNTKLPQHSLTENFPGV
jgi:hypothetical protein